MSKMDLREGGSRKAFTVRNRISSNSNSSRSLSIRLDKGGRGVNKHLNKDRGSSLIPKIVSSIDLHNNNLKMARKK